MLEYCIFNSLFTSILLTTGLFVLFARRIKIINYLFFFCVSTISIFCSTYNDKNYLILVFLGVASIYITWSTKQKEAIISIFLIYIIDCISLYIVIYIFNKLFNYSVQDVNSNPSIAIRVVVPSIVIASLLILALKYLGRKYLTMNIDAISKKVLLFISLLFISCAFLIYEVLITYGSNIQSSHYVPLITLIVLFFLLTTISAVSILLITKKNYENQQQLNNLRTLQEYTDNLEATYNSLRSFKHDYINILSSISLYIDDKRYDELSDFFHDKIMPMKDELTHKNAALANLSRVKNLEIKSILYTKFLMAINQNIDVTIDIADEIGTLKIDSIDLTRILGIYLDNAIEAAVETEHPEVCFHLGVTNNSTVFIISNSYVDHGLSISQMTQKDVSSKGSDHGLGLYNVSKILSKYDNIFTDTSTHEGSFIQQLQIV